jgi:hypothetical protein
MVNRLRKKTTKLLTLVVRKRKKDLDFSKSLISLGFLAPRPGLEPGTYGLTEIQAPQKPL